MATLVIAGVGAGVGLIRRQDQGTNTSPFSEAPTPTSWDSRVAPFVDFVEAHRGHVFKHPVQVDFLSEADYVALFEPGSASDAARAAAAAHASVLSAAGLTGGVDEGDTDSRVAQTASLGFYSFAARAIEVRGKTITPALQVVLVHELTHALQAQWFDFRLGDIDDLEIRSIVEADAMRIEDEYSATLATPDRTQAEIDNGSTDEIETQLAQIPWALVQRNFAPYDLGPLFLRIVAPNGDNASVDQVFADFPTEEELVSPERYALGDADAAVPVAIPEGASVIDDPHRWPMYDALVMLDAWLPWNQARAPFDGWAAGGYVSYELDDGHAVCFRASARFDTTDGAAQFADAVTAWAALSGSDAVPSRADRRVTFDACDRGEAATLPPSPPLSTSESVLLEHALTAIVGEQSPAVIPALIPCVARTLIDDPTMLPVFSADELTDQQRDIITLETAIATTACST